MGYLFSVILEYYTIFDYFTLENLNDFQIIQDYIIRNQYTAFFVRRNSILLPSINEFWSHTNQHGFAIRWEIDVCSKIKITFLFQEFSAFLKYYNCSRRFMETIA